MLQFIWFIISVIYHSLSLLLTTYNCFDIFILSNRFYSSAYSYLHAFIPFICKLQYSSIHSLLVFFGISLISNDILSIYFMVIASACSLIFHIKSHSFGITVIHCMSISIYPSPNTCSFCHLLFIYPSFWFLFFKKIILYFNNFLLLPQIKMHCIKLLQISKHICIMFVFIWS